MTEVNNSLAVLPYGELASESYDNSIKIWEPRDPRGHLHVLCKRKVISILKLNLTKNIITVKRRYARLSCFFKKRNVLVFIITKFYIFFIIFTNLFLY
jgi:hypothetical protein